MSLQVWMPLNGDLHNQGLSNLIFTNVNSNYTAIDNGGKIGKCYTNNSHTEGGLVSNTTINLGQKQSMFCWFKFTDLLSSSSLGGNLVSQHRYSSNQGLGISIKYVSSTTGYLSVNTGNGSSRTYNTYCGTTLLQANTWYHGGFTYDNGTMKIYVNGICEKTVDIGTQSVPADYLVVFAWSLNSTSGSGVFGNYKLQGSLNDVRVYNHCLSEREVKKLAQGLVVHYPLNRNGLGQENLWYNSSCQDNLSYMVQGSNAFSITTKDGYKCAHLSGQLNTTGYLSIPQTMIPEKNGWYTISADMRLDNYVAGTTNPYVGIYFGGDYLNTDNTGGWYGGSSYSGDGQAGSVFPGNYNNKGWHRVTCTVQYLYGGSDYKKGPFRLGFIYARDFTGDLYVKNIKFEKGKVATTWCPHVWDNGSITARTGGAEELDISGFNNHGIKTIINENLLVGSALTSEYTTGFVSNSSGDWTKYLRYYNGSASIHSFSNGEDTITLNSASNLGICFVRLARDMALDSSSYYTISCEAKSTQTAQPLCIGLSYYNTSNSWIWRGGSNPKSFTATNTWQKFSLTFKPDADTQYICYCFTVVGVSGGTNTFTIRHCKLEKGMDATLWVPGIYTEHSADTPKYQVSTHIGSTSSKIHLSNFPTGGFGNSYSFAWWGKNTAFGSPMFWGFSDGIRLNGMHTGRLWNTGDSESNPLYEINTTTQVSAPSTNTWHHYVMTGNGTKCYVYLDGNLWAEAKTYKAISGTSIYINGWDSSVNYSYDNMDIVDFRIYATALSANDVKSLYQNCATIGPDGTIYGKIRN